MSVPKDHHYVPQFYFRNFSQDPEQRTIHLIRKSNGQIVLNQRIKSQSKRRDLYVKPEIEGVFSHLESEIASCFRTLIDGAAHFSTLRRRDSIHYTASGGLLLQATRLPQRGEGFHESFLPLFQIAMQLDVSKNPDVPSSVREELERGELFFDYDSRYDVLSATHVALLAPLLFLDMTMVLVANATDLPFVFSDEPAICTNRLLWKYRDIAGITGFGSRGLICFLPLCERLALLFFDGGAYRCNSNCDQPIVLNSHSDVGLFNAFQAHSAHNVIYFGDEKAEDYVQRLTRAHRGCGRTERFVLKRAQSVSGTSELVHQFERPIPIPPNFSFLELRRDPTPDDLRLPRNEELMNIMEEMTQASMVQDSSFTQNVFEATIREQSQKTTPLRERC